MKEIQTNGKTLLFVEVPSDASVFRMAIYPVSGTWVVQSDSTSLNAYKQRLKSGNYQILSKSTELSEEQMKGICEHGKLGYLNYKNQFSSDPSKAFTNTVQESYLSMLEANGIVDRNSIPEPNHLDFKTKNTFGEINWSSPVYKYKYSLYYDLWQEAQSKVKHYLVLEKI